MRINFASLIAIGLLIACEAKPKYQTGDYLMPSGSSDPTKIVKVVAVTDSTYKVFTHFLSDGRLTEAQDYQNVSRTSVDSNYVRVIQPKVQGSFSPDAYLSKQGASGAARR